MDAFWCSGGARARAAHASALVLGLKIHGNSLGFVYKRLELVGILGIFEALNWFSPGMHSWLRPCSGAL